MFAHPVAVSLLTYQVPKRLKNNLNCILQVFDSIAVYLLDTFEIRGILYMSVDCSDISETRSALGKVYLILIQQTFQKLSSYIHSLCIKEGCNLSITLVDANPCSLRG